MQMSFIFFGLGVVDSFAMQTPMITTSSPTHGPEVEYIENGINGLITNDNIKDYSNTVINTLKTDGYNQLIEGCKLSSKVFTVENMVNNFRGGVISCLGPND